MNLSTSEDNGIQVTFERQKSAENNFQLRSNRAIIELAASMSLIDNMKKESFLKTILGKEELPIKHYPDSRIYACVIPARIRKESDGLLPNRVTGNTREVVIDKLFDLFSGKKSGSGKNTLTILYKEFIENRKKDEDIASQTARKNECDWNTFFKDKPLVLADVSDITPADIMAHFKSMTEGRKMTRHAFGNAKGLLNQLFDLAYEKNLVERNICRQLSTKKLKFKPEACKQDLVYSKDERDQIVDELKTSDNVYDKAIVIQSSALAAVFPRSRDCAGQISILTEGKSISTGNWWKMRKGTRYLRTIRKTVWEKETGCFP